MYLELHDSDAPNTRCARIGAKNGIDYDYQAEQWVQHTAVEKQTQDPRPNRWVVLWVLLDEQGERARWERASGDLSRPKLVRVAPRFTGKWRVGT